MNICTIIGVRPQFVKAAVLSPIIRKEHKEILIHTGQHYDTNMSDVFFRELGLPKPDYMLAPAIGKNQERIDSMVRQLIPIIQREKADAVLIYGDTNSTLACALAADQLKIPVIHVEAGERNGLVNNPEEQIRMRVDQLSSLLLGCSPQAMENLRKEGLEDRSHYIGNLMEASFCKNIKKHWHPHLISLVDKSNIQVPQKFYLLTCHRQENANDSNLTELLSAMNAVDFPVLYPVHPRNKERVLRLVTEHSFRNIILTEPVGYFDSIHLINNAVTVVTDSGGVLQEAHFAQTPYVFVLDIPKPPSDTRFDSSRLARPKRDEILEKLRQPQHFDEITKNEAVDLHEFENNLLDILRNFEQLLRTGH